MVDYDNFRSDRGHLSVGDSTCVLANPPSSRGDPDTVYYDNFRLYGTILRPVRDPCHGW